MATVVALRALQGPVLVYKKIFSSVRRPAQNSKTSVAIITAPVIPVRAIGKMPDQEAVRIIVLETRGATDPRLI